MPRPWIPALCLTTAFAAPVVAVELGGLSPLGIRAACVAYVALDLTRRFREGTVSQPEFSAATGALFASIQGQGGRPNAGLERVIDEMMARITAEAPDEAEVTAKVAHCRTALDWGSGAS